MSANTLMLIKEKISVKIRIKEMRRLSVCII